MANNNQPRWYCINSEGLATLCADKGDAEKVAAESDAAFPRFAPHVASRMFAIDFKAPACSRVPRTAAYLVHGEEDDWVEITPTEGSNLRRDELVKRDDAIAYAAACAAGWQRAPAIGNPRDLISFAEGRIEHANRGHCPGAHEGFDSRDPDCEVCKAINAALSPAVSEFDVEAIYEAFKTWPDDIRRKLSFHDLRRMNGWTPPKPTTLLGAVDEAATLTAAGMGQADFGMQSRSDAWERVAEVLGEVSPNWVVSRNGMSGVECAVDEIRTLAEAAARAAGLLVAGWINEDALPDGYPYDVMFPHSKVDGVRLFPVYAPAAAENVFQPIDQAPKNGCGILALLPDSNFPVGIRWNDGRWCVAWDNSPLGEFDQPVKFMHIPDEDATALVVYLPRKLIAEAECLKSWHLRMAEMEIAAGVDISAGIPDSAVPAARARAVGVVDGPDRGGSISQSATLLRPLPSGTKLYANTEPTTVNQQTVVGYRWRNSDHHPWTLGETVSGFDISSREIGAAIEPLGVVNQKLTTACGYGLNDEQVALLLAEGLKPEEIGGTAELQHARVGELVRWFARLATKSANPKWAVSHAFELAYFVATSAGNRHIDIKLIREAAYKEGAMVSPSDRGMLERIGFLQPMPVADADR